MTSGYESFDLLYVGSFIGKSLQSKLCFQNQHQFYLYGFEIIILKIQNMCSGTKIINENRNPWMTHFKGRIFSNSILNTKCF